MLRQNKLQRSYRVYQVDSFTRERFKGNPAGVFPDARGLTERQMQELARELNNSETAFIFPSEVNAYDVSVRFFTPTREVPSCGHATIAAHYVRAVEHQLPTTTVWQKIGIGVLPVDVLREGADYRIVMTQGKVDFLGEVDAPAREAILSALKLNANDLDARCPVEHVSTGHSKIILGINSRARLNSISPDLVALEKLGRELRCRGFFVFTFDSNDAEILTHARMFAPQIGINEDPVTGNGNGPLGAYIVKNGLAQHDGKRFAFKGQQGEAINRTGVAHVTVEIENNLPVRVKVGGDAVIAFQTQFMLEVTGCSSVNG
jgi:PhzF family phenazine biosynthesis protein